MQFLRKRQYFRSCEKIAWQEHERFTIKRNRKPVCHDLKIVIVRLFTSKYKTNTPVDILSSWVCVIYTGEYFVIFYQTCYLNFVFLYLLDTFAPKGNQCSVLLGPEMIENKPSAKDLTSIDLQETITQRTHCCKVSWRKRDFLGLMKSST